MIYLIEHPSYKKHFKTDTSNWLASRNIETLCIVNGIKSTEQ